MCWKRYLLVAIGQTGGAGCSHLIRRSDFISHLGVNRRIASSWLRDSRVSLMNGVIIITFKMNHAGGFTRRR